MQILIMHCFGDKLESGSEFITLRYKLEQIYLQKEKTPKWHAYLEILKDKCLD